MGAVGTEKFTEDTPGKKDGKHEREDNYFMGK